MVCPECGSGEIRVIDINKDYLMRSGKALLDWWDQGCFIVRKRGCKNEKCLHTWRSVELPILDLRDALDEKASAIRAAISSAASKLEDALRELKDSG